jgi:predicted DNA-binding ribbon-helix-helix protein
MIAQVIAIDRRPEGQPSDSRLCSRNIALGARRTSVRLEPEIWQALRDIAYLEQCSINVICGLIDRRKPARSSLTSAIRVFVMLYFRAAATTEGHRAAGHGMMQELARRVGLVRSKRGLA